MTTLLIKNAIVITVNQERQLFESGAVLIEDQHIVAVGPSDEVSRNHPSADRVIDGARKVVAPGFISTHNHVGYTMFRGRAEDIGLNCVMGQYFPMNTIISRDERRAIGSLTYAELLRSGVTTFLEMEEDVDVYAEFVDRLGVRSAMGVMIHDVEVEAMRRGEFRFDEALRRTQLSQALEFAQVWNGKANGRIRTMMTPNMTISSSPALLSGVRDAADRLGIRLSVHLGWGAEEEVITQRLHNRSPFVYLHDHGLLGPDVVAAHCYVIGDDDKQLLAHSGAHVAHCPLMNAVRGHIAPVMEYRQSGIPVSLAIDNMFSDYFEVVRACVMMARIKTGDPTVMPAPDALELATIAGARALGLDAEVGSIETGKRADLMVLDYSRFGLRPTLDPIQNLVYHARREDVDMVLVDGEILVQDGVVCSLDAKALIEPAHSCATEAWRRFVAKYDGIIAKTAA